MRTYIYNESSVVPPFACMLRKMSTTNVTKAGKKMPVTKSYYDMNEEEKEMQQSISSFVDESTYHQVNRYTGSLGMLSVEARGSIFSMYDTHYRFYIYLYTNKYT